MGVAYFWAAQSLSAGAAGAARRDGRESGGVTVSCDRATFTQAY